MKFKFEHIIILVLLVVILWMRACPVRPISQEPVIQTTTITKYDTLRVTTNQYIPKYITKVSNPKIIYLKSETDTSLFLDKLINKHYSIYFSTDTINHDSVKICINDTITENKIKSRQVKYEIKYPTKIITKTILTPSKRELYYGFGIGGEKSGFNYLGGELMLKMKKPQAFSVGVGINDNLKLNINTRFLWKLGK